MQKARIGVFSGCLEHANAIWHQLRWNRETGVWFFWVLLMPLACQSPAGQNPPAKKKKKTSSGHEWSSNPVNVAVSPFSKADLPTRVSAYMESQYQRFRRTQSKALEALVHSRSQRLLTGGTTYAISLTISGLKKINSTALPGKLKLWCFQFGLLPRLMWPINTFPCIQLGTDK